VDRYLIVLLGGGFGSLTRYIFGTTISERLGGRFPVGTFVINVSGSFLIGLLMTLLTERLNLQPNWRLLLVVGFLGGYTTFSTFEYETFRAFQDGSQWIAVLNAVGSVAVGYAAVWLGVTIASRM
jgi:CrcB protein